MALADVKWINLDNLRTYTNQLIQNTDNRYISSGDALASLPVATTSSNGLMSSNDKTKLDEMGDFAFATSQDISTMMNALS